MDRVTGEPRPFRVGYTNADPWYDGRAHDDSIVDSPRSGTVLSAEEIERILVQFGGHAEGEIAPSQFREAASPDRPPDDKTTVRLEAPVGASTSWHRPEPARPRPTSFSAIRTPSSNGSKNASTSLSRNGGGFDGFFRPPIVDGWYGMVRTPG